MLSKFQGMDLEKLRKFVASFADDFDFRVWVYHQSVEDCKAMVAYYEKAELYEQLVHIRDRIWGLDCHPKGLPDKGTEPTEP